MSSQFPIKKQICNSEHFVITLTVQTRQCKTEGCISLILCLISLFLSMFLIAMILNSALHVCNLRSSSLFIQVLIFFHLIVL